MKNGQGEWWRTFFEGLAVELWLAAADENQTNLEVDFIERVLELPPGGGVLDVPCGGGRHALALAARGYRAAGVDLAPQFLEAARSGAAEQEARVDWQQRDMRDLPWKGEFDGALCFGNSFGYLDEQGNRDFLSALASTLKPEGHFVLDSSAVAESLLPNLQQRRWFEAGDILMLIRNTYDHRCSRLETEYTFVRKGDVERRHSSQRVYTYLELCRLLGDAGFGGLQAFCSLNEQPFHAGAHRLLMVAEKTA